MKFLILTIPSFFLFAFVNVNEIKKFNSSLFVSNDKYPFTPIDTIHIGEDRYYKTLQQYFDNATTKDNLLILIDEGTYYSISLWVEGQNLIIRGTGKVNLYCTSFVENVMWVNGKNIFIENLHMKHFAPGSFEGQNCTGRVIAFDNASYVTIEGCDLNGCGLAGLHDNLGNDNILIKDNYIHNNSVGAYTNIDGDVWHNEISNHPVFIFENNRIENNGVDRIAEPNDIKDYISDCPKEIESQVIKLIQHTYNEWKDVENELIIRYIGADIGDYFHLNFEDLNGKVYDFGFGNNDLNGFELFNEDHVQENTKYIGTQFTLYWEWKLSTFPCCSGEYESVKAYLPSIVKLEKR